VLVTGSVERRLPELRSGVSKQQQAVSSVCLREHDVAASSHHRLILLPLPPFVSFLIIIILIPLPPFLSFLIIVLFFFLFLLLFLFSSSYSYSSSSFSFFSHHRLILLPLPPFVTFLIIIFLFLFLLFFLFSSSSYSSSSSSFSFFSHHHLILLPLPPFLSSFSSTSRQLLYYHNSAGQVQAWVTVMRVAVVVVSS